MAVPDALTAFSAAQVTGDQQIQLTWTYAGTGTPATKLYLQVYFLNVATPTLLADVYVQNTIEPHTYTFAAPPATWRVKATPTNADGFGPTSTAADVVVGGSAAAITATVSGAATPSTISLAAQGFLHGLTDGLGNVNSEPYLIPLRTKSWRMADAVPDPYARSAGYSRTQVLSDFWQSTHQSGGFTVTPWSNFTTWENWVTSKINEMIAGGWLPDYIDIWNEPNNDNFSAADQASMTVGNFNEMFKRAYNAIKAIDPTIKVIAPSTDAPYWTDTGLAINFGGFALDQFLAYSATNGLVWDAISWHENQQRVVDAGDLYGIHQTNIGRHIAMYKAVVAAHPGTVATPLTILVNEYGPALVRFQAGHHVGYFRAFEDGGVAQANRAVWATNEYGIGGLLTSGTPNAIWWAHRKYADMDGQTRVAVTTNSSYQASGLATRDDATSTVRVLLGRHYGGASAIGAANATVDVSIDWPYGDNPVDVLIEKLPTGSAALVDPVVVSETTITPVSGAFVVSVPNIHDGDAISILATGTPSSVPTGAKVGITSSFAEPFFTGGATTSEVPATYEVAIDGRGYMLDTNSGQFKHASIPLIRQQADQSDTPGEQSLNPEDLWRRSVDTWHKGAGQTYLDAKDSDEGRYHASKGIDPWTQGQATLLPATIQKTTSGNATIQLAVAGSNLYLLDGDTLTFTTNITAGTPSFTNVTGAGFDTAHSIASDGFNVWVVDDVDLYYTTRNLTTYSTWLTDPLPGSLVRYVKGRLILAAGRSIWNPGAQGTAAPSAEVFTHPNTDWVWTDIAEGPNAIYAAGYSGDKSIIYRTAFDAQQADLDVPTVAAVLPDGEIVRSVQGYLGFLLIGTDKGLRFAATSSNGDLELGDLVRVGTVQAFEPQDRFVWFGWSNYDPDSTGLGRVDLRTLNGTQPAYASDLMAGTQGITTSIVTFQDLRVFTIAGSGVWCESSEKVASGEITSGLIGYRLSSTKTALFLETQHRKGEGSYQAALSADESDFVNVGGAVVTSLNQAGIDSTSVGQLSGELFETRYTLFRSPVDTTEAPVLGRTTLRADPQAPRRYKIQVPILLGSNVKGQEFNVAFERQQIKALAQSRRPVSYQEGNTSFTVIVEDFEWVPHHSEGFPSYDYAGTLTVSMKTIN